MSLTLVAQAGADDVALARAALERFKVGARDVGNINVVARLLAIPVDAHAFLPQKLSDKDGDDARLTVGVLARPVNVSVAQRGEVQIL